MSKRYAIWDKESDVITPSGNLYTAEEWKEKHPAAKRDDVTVVCLASKENGGFYGTLEAMKQKAEAMGCVFEEGLNDQQTLEAIEAFEDEWAKKAQEEAQKPTTEERIAAALEYQNLLSL